MTTIPQPTPKSSTFVVQILPSLFDKLIADLTAQGFSIDKPPYTLFAAKKKGISCTLYESGKLVVQGKEMGPFIEFYLEPEVLGQFHYTYQAMDVDKTARIGIDESGKGDFFGPLCVGGVFAAGEQVSKLLELGVKDSKSLSDKTIRALAAKIRESCVWTVVRINPSKYNELYPQFGNLNSLLAWCHATAIENLIHESHCRRVIIDQFADERVVLKALKRKNIDLDLTQRHRAEEDLVVAAASILARDAFLHGLEGLEQHFGLHLPKGASSQTVAAGKKLLAKHGKDALRESAKLHFKTFSAITQEIS